MDAKSFDAWVRTVSPGSSRRHLLGGVLAGLLLPIGAEARGAGKHRKRKSKSKSEKAKHKGKEKQRASAQAETCWRAGACIPKKGANVSRCDLEGYTSSTLNCTGCNASRANLRGAKLQGANFTKANLSGACLIDADFTGATFTNTTNLADAIFCGTKMPDGIVNNSGCGDGTACCSTCTPTTCEALGKTCGAWPDGCGGALQCGSCPATQTCVDGTSCLTCDVCASGCTFSSIQAAINATSPQLSTIRVCPGTYTDAATVSIAVEIRRALTLIGAGDGADPTTNTIVRPALTNQNVVLVGGAGIVRLEGIRITGGNGTNGRGIGVIDSTVTMANCTLTENHPTIDSQAPVLIGGTGAAPTQVTLLNSRITKNSAPLFGGVLVNDGTLILDTLSRVTDNTATRADGVGGILTRLGPVQLPSVDNVTGNTPKNCGGSAITGPGAVCLTT